MSFKNYDEECIYTRHNSVKTLRHPLILTKRQPTLHRHTKYTGRL